MKSLPISLAVLLLQGASPGQRLQPGSIEGIVVKSGSADVRLQFPTIPNGTGAAGDDTTAGVGEPLSGATVELTGTAGDRVQSRSVKTGRDGKFSFKDITPGEAYELIAIYSPDYLPAHYGQRYPGLPGQPISIAAGQQIKDARIIMTRTAQVSGRVLDSGRVRTGAVSAIRPFYEDGRRVLGSMAYGKSGVVATDVTNNRGEFKISGLPPGQYYFCLGNTGQVCTPAPVNLRSGDSQGGVTIDFRATDQQVVQGQLISRVTGRPLDSGRIGIVSDDSVPNPPSTPFRNSPSVFVATVRFGTYFLLGAGIENGIPMFGYTPVSVRGQNIPPLQIVLEPAFNISGQLTGGSSPGTTIRLQSLIPGMTETPIAPVSNDGTFTLKGATVGEYRVIVATPLTANTYLQSIRFGGREVPDSILRFTSHSNGRLEISLGRNAATVSGKVLRASGAKSLPASGIHVVLVPDNARRSRRDLYKDAFSDSSGTFQLSGIAPGTYKLFAWELVEDGAWEDPVFMQLYENFGKTIRVSESSRESSDIDLIPPWN